MEYLKQYRTARHLTQQDMADLLNISRVTYARYESGTHEPDIATMIRIGATLGVLIDQLVGVIEPDETYSSDLFHQVRSMQSGALDVSAPDGFVGMYGNSNYFLLTKDGQDKVNAYIDDLYGNPQYADDAGHIVLRDPKSGEAIMQTIAADHQDDTSDALSVRLNTAAVHAADTYDANNDAQKNKA